MPAKTRMSALRKAGARSKKTKRVRFAAVVEESLDPGTPPCMRPLTVDAGASATRKRLSEGQGVTKHEGNATVGIVEQITHDARGVWRDLRGLDELPPGTFFGKIQFVLAQETRTQSLLHVMGLLLIVTCAVASVVLLARISSSSGRSADLTAGPRVASTPAQP